METRRVRPAVIPYVICMGAFINRCSGVTVAGRSSLLAEGKFEDSSFICFSHEDACSLRTRLSWVVGFPSPGSFLLTERQQLVNDPVQCSELSSGMYCRVK
jgi:hypothetical protein